MVNKKLVYRLSSEEGQGPRSRRRKPHRRTSVQVRELRPPVGQPNESWRMGFMADQLVGGQRFRLLMLVDNHSRESPGHRGRPAANRCRCCSVLGACDCRAWQAAKYSSRQRAEVRLQELGSVGVLPRCEARRQSTRNAHGECIDRIIQRQASRRVVEPALVLVARRSSRCDRSVEGG